MSCKMRGLRVTIPVPLGKIDLPTSASITEDFPELCMDKEHKNEFNSSKPNAERILYLRSHDDDLRELDGIGANGVEHVLQLVDDRNEGLHDANQGRPRPVRKLLASSRAI